MSAARGETLVAFIRWALHEGAAQAEAMEYTTLPGDTVAHYDSVLTALAFGRCGRVTAPAASATGAASGPAP